MFKKCFMLSIKLLTCFKLFMYSIDFLWMVSGHFTTEIQIHQFYKQLNVSMVRGVS